MSRASSKDDVDLTRWPSVERLAVLGISRASQYRLGHVLGAKKVGTRALRIPPKNILRVLGQEAYDAIMGISEVTPERVAARKLLKQVAANLLARCARETPDTSHRRSQGEAFEPHLKGKTAVPNRKPPEPNADDAGPDTGPEAA